MYFSIFVILIGFEKVNEKCLVFNLQERHQARAEFHQAEADKLTGDADAVRAHGEGEVDGDSSFLQRLEQLNMIREEHENLMRHHQMKVAKQDEKILRLVQSRGINRASAKKGEEARRLAALEQEVLAKLNNTSSKKE